MAKDDYTLCQVCGAKMFHSTALNWGRTDLKPDYCAQLAAICDDCSGNAWRLQVIIKE